METSIKCLEHYRRIVIKIGSSLLVDLESGLHKEWLESLCKDISYLHGKNVEILLVSSGAVALGRSIFGLKSLLSCNGHG